MDERSGVMAAIRLVLAHMYGGLSVDLLTSSVLLIEWNRTVMLCMGRHDFSQRKKNLLVGEHLDLSRKRMAALARTGARVGHFLIPPNCKRTSD